MVTRHCHSTNMHRAYTVILAAYYRVNRAEMLERLVNDAEAQVIGRLTARQMAAYNRVRR
jgi:hypothetical protein